MMMINFVWHDSLLVAWLANIPLSSAKQTRVKIDGCSGSPMSQSLRRAEITGISITQIFFGFNFIFWIYQTRKNRRQSLLFVFDRIVFCLCSVFQLRVSQYQLLEIVLKSDAIVNLNWELKRDAVTSSAKNMDSIIIFANMQHASGCSFVLTDNTPNWNRHFLTRQFLSEKIVTSCNCSTSRCGKYCPFHIQNRELPVKVSSRKCIVSYLAWTPCSLTAQEFSILRRISEHCQISAEISCFVQAFMFCSRQLRTVYRVTSRISLPK